jgi:O-methyltransferase domain
MRTISVRSRPIADVGSGGGHLIMAILGRVTTAKGILFELPHVVADVTATPPSRLHRIAGDFLADPLPDADAEVRMKDLYSWVSS